MLKHPSLTERRIEILVTNVLRRLFFEPVVSLEAAVHQTRDPIPYDEAVGASYRPVRPGFRWGPPWSTAWFRFRGRLPTSVRGKTVWLHVDVGSEACLWKDGMPYRGLNPEHHRGEIVVRKARGGERVELFVEAACNALFGVKGYGGAEHGAEPALFSTAELGVVREEVWGLYNDMRVLFDLMRSLPEHSVRRARIRYALNEAVNLFIPEDCEATAPAARAALADELRLRSEASAARVSVTGHSHIDTAWLWPLRETVRKCSRTFSTVLRLMERYPEYRYQQGQPQLYAFVKEYYPKLYRRIRDRIREGRWEAAGAMWVEADCNVTSGESLVRQILHGQRFYRREFGVTGSYLWLPDVFGYSAALPQILAQCGLDTFITQKISWNQFNVFPHHSFWWEGIDGTRIFSHFLPANNYNGLMTPSELRAASERFAEADRCRRWLYVFGWGDGGGGPEEEMLESFRRCRDLEGLPRLEMEPIGRYVRRALDEARDLPVWVGELYLELHRGTYTTHARNKRANRKSEFLLRDAEILAALSGRPVRRKDAAALDRAWKLVLLNQFHDIIPGSSIGWVYEDSRRQYEEVRTLGEGVRNHAMRRWAASVDTRSARRPLVVWNTLSWDRSGWLDLPAETVAGAESVASPGGAVLPVQRVRDPFEGDRVLLPVEGAPSLGHVVLDLDPEGKPPRRIRAAARAGRGFLENGLLRIEVDERGRLIRVYDKERDREILAEGRPANDLVLSEDRPNNFDAWDIDVFYLEKPLRDERPAKIRVVERGPWRAALLVERPVGDRSFLRQKIEIRRDSRRIDFVTRVDWDEERRLLRVLFPVEVHSGRATYEIQYGNAERPTHFNTSWDWARFEAPAHKWVDLHEADYGVALMNDCKYGHSVHGNVMGISLLRAPTSPDPKADRGTHEFTYSLFPHPGDYRAGGVIRAAYELNVPMRAALEKRHGGAAPPTGSLLSVEDPNVVVEAVKPAEDGDGRIIVRFYDAWGRRGAARLRFGFELEEARAVDLLERPTRLFPVRRIDAREIEVPYGPFSIRTIAVRRKG